MATLYRVQYGEIEINETDTVYEEGDLILLTDEAAAFLGDQVTPAPDALAPSVDVDSIAGSYGHELAITNIIDVGEIAEIAGPVDDVNDIDVEAIEENYRGPR